MQATMQAADCLSSLLRNLVSFEADPLYTSSDRTYLMEKHLEMLEALPKVPHAKFVATAAGTAPNGSFSAIALKKDKMLSIQDILGAGIDYVHQGKFLLCRSILPPVKMAAQVLLVDDPVGERCLRVSLYNFSAMVRPGTILAIMHPWFKRSADMSAGVRVENPMHICLFAENEVLIRDVVWKAPLPKEAGEAEERPEGDSAWEGNRYFNDQNYQKAIEAYSKAIEEDPTNAVLFSNRAYAYLKVDQPDKALSDAEAGLKLQPANIKLFYRKCKALILLKRYEEATSLLKKASRIKEAMELKGFADLVNESQTLLGEFKEGNYDVLKMIEEAKRKKLLDNHADYLSPMLELKNAKKGKGRRLVAKQNIETGTLLVACKAFVYAEVMEGAISIDWANKAMETVTFAPLVQKASEKLFNNPKLADEFYKLNAGENLGSLGKADRSKPVDIDRISGIVRLNTFAVDDYFGVKESHGLTDGGLWILPSFIKHSCVDCNCFRFVVGDFMFIRAAKNINPGETLLTTFVPPTMPYRERLETLRNNFGVDCRCRLCQADQKEPGLILDRYDEIRKITDDIYRKREKNGRFAPGDESKLKGLLEEALTYRPNKDINFVAAHVQYILVMAVSYTHPVHSVQLLEDLFNTRNGAHDLFAALKDAKLLAQVASFKGEKEVAKWKKIAKKLAKKLFGDSAVGDLIEGL